MSILGTILLGIFRFFVLIMILFYLNRVIFNTSSKNTFLEFFVRIWIRYAGLLGVLIFVSVTFGFYSLYNLLSIIFSLCLFDILGRKNIRHFESYLIKQIKIGIHFLFKNHELKIPVSSWFKLIDENQKRFIFIVEFLIIIGLIGGVLFGRINFFDIDEYTLSNLWNSDLIRVMNFDNQIWFDSEMNLSGELAFVNFFSKLVNINHEVSLQAMAVLENLVMVIIVFWSIRSITSSQYLAPLISCFIFGVLFGVLPINMTFLLQPKASFLALTFALPLMIYLFKPNLINLKSRNFFAALFITFLTIALIDLFVFCVLLPVFFLISLFFYQNFFIKRYWLAMLSYVLALFIAMTNYYWICSQKEKDFLGFLHSNFISVDIYTYLPQLILPLSYLLTTCFFGAVIGILLLLKLIFYNKENWNLSMAFLIYFIVLTLGLTIKNPWLDTELLLQSFTIFIPILIGIDLAILIRIFSPIFKRFERFQYAGIMSIISVFLISAFHFQKNNFHTKSQTGSISLSVLEVYDRLISDYFPFSYAVVNDYRTQVLSVNEHFFLNYSTFIKEYPDRDSVYFIHQKDIVFLKTHPDKVIPKSVFLFVYKKSLNSNYLTENVIVNSDLINLLKLLQKRGRKIELFQENEHFKVFEIINEPGSSKVSDLIF